MKTWEIQAEFGIDNLELTDRPDPEPGYGEVVVAVKACSLNFRDYLVVSGLYDLGISFPWVPLSDGRERSPPLGRA